MCDFTVLTNLPPGQNGRHFADVFFQCFSWMKSFEFRFEFHWSSSNWDWVSIVSGKGLVPNLRQAITWTNAESVHWHTYPLALGGDELEHLTHWGWEKWSPSCTRYFQMYFVSNFTEICHQGTDRSTIRQYWFRWWLGTEQAASQYLNHWCLLTHICVSRPRQIINLDDLCTKLTICDLNRPSIW